MRDLGGLVRAAGDLAVEKNHKLVTAADVVAARHLASPIEAQVVTQEIEYRKAYRVFETHGFKVGKVNGLAVIGNSTMSAGIVVPIVAEVTPASSRSEGTLDLDLTLVMNFGFSPRYISLTIDFPNCSSFSVTA